MLMPPTMRYADARYDAADDYACRHATRVAIIFAIYLLMAI